MCFLGASLDQTRKTWRIAARTFFFDSTDRSPNKTFSMGVEGEGYRQEDGREMGENRPKPNSITQPRPLPEKPSRKRFNSTPNHPPHGSLGLNALAKFLLRRGIAQAE